MSIAGRNIVENSEPDAKRLKIFKDAGGAMLVFGTLVLHGASVERHKLRAATVHTRTVV